MRISNYEELLFTVTDCIELPEHVMVMATEMVFDREPGHLTTVCMNNPKEIEKAKYHLATKYMNEVDRLEEEEEEEEEDGD